ncbi:MAG: SIMPL domain-containing protein [Sphingomonas sp.]|nr:SIMPL domain-containing protein [Sphingomonas sp.]
MRLVGAALVAAAAFGAATGSLRAQPVSAAPLAPGEVLLEMSVTGTSRVRAESARILVTVNARGASPVEARTAVEAMVQQVVGIAESAGVAAADIRPARRSGPVGFVGNEAFPDDETQLAMIAAQAQQGRNFASRVLEVVIRAPERADRVRAALEEAGVGMVSAPIYRADDEGAARRAARADALAKARADAEAYAASIGMRVARIVRISERMGAEGVGWTVFATMMRQAAGNEAVEGSEVETQVHLAVDFALAAR